MLIWPNEHDKIPFNRMKIAKSINKVPSDVVCECVSVCACVCRSSGEANLSVAMVRMRFCLPILP